MYCDATDGETFRTTNPKTCEGLTELALCKVAMTGPGALARVTCEPVGVAGAVLPWTFALAMATWKIAREEIFGPILGIMPVNSAQEALAIASDTDYGLHASLFTQDIDQAIHMARSFREDTWH